MSQPAHTLSSGQIGPRPYRTLVEALAAAPAARPFVTTWIDEDDADTLTFGEFTRRAQSQAFWFQEQGLRARDTVILIMPQGTQLMTAFVGAILLGAIPAILAYPNFKVEPAKYSSGLARVSANLRAQLVVIDEAFPKELLAHISIGDRTKLLRSIEKPTPSIQTALPDSDPITDSESVAFIQHSAGTTGLQKGVALSHASVLKQVNHLAMALQLRNEDRIYSWLPLYHDMGLIACFMLPLVFHVPIVMQSPTDWVMKPDTMLQIISQFKCTLGWVPNFALQFLARRVPPAERANYDLSSLRSLINCSEPVRAQSMDEFLEAYSPNGLRPDVLQSSYAMAENTFAVTQSGLDGANGPRRLWLDGARFRNDHEAVSVPESAKGSVCFVSSGQVLPGNEVRIVSPSGADLPEGSVGEILIRSDSMFRGYYKRPELNAKSIQNGWYWSGDLGFYLDDELYVTGRKKDLIIVAGNNIYPQDVEEIVFSHPSIHDGRGVAFGLFNNDLGTEDIVVVAEVGNEKDLENALLIEREVRRTVMAELGLSVRRVYLKPPGWIVKSTAGKPARSATRDKLMSEHFELNPGDALARHVVDGPLTPNGKVDPNALPDLAHDAEAQRQFTEPGTDVELMLAAIWRDVLGVEEISVQDNFFDLGGHSLSAMQIAFEIRRVFNIDFPLRSFFEAPILGGQARQLQEKLLEQADPRQLAELINEAEETPRSDGKSQVECKPA